MGVKYVNNSKIKLLWLLSGALNMYNLCLSNFDTIINLDLVAFFTLTVVYSVKYVFATIEYYKFLFSLITLMVFYVKFIH